LKQLKDIVARVGDLIAILECDIEGFPRPTIQWYDQYSKIHQKQQIYRKKKKEKKEIIQFCPLKV